MIHHSPSNFLSLRKNIQYFNSHKDTCFLDTNLNVIDKHSAEVINRISVDEITHLIFNKIQEFYSGTLRDDNWIKLIKNDIKQLDSQESPIASKMIVKIENLQQQHPKDLQTVDG